MSPIRVEQLKSGLGTVVGPEWSQADLPHCLDISRSYKGECRNTGPRRSQLFTPPSDVNTIPWAPQINPSYIKPSPPPMIVGPSGGLPQYIKPQPPPMLMPTKTPAMLYVGLGVLGAAVVGGIVWFARR